MDDLTIELIGSDTATCDGHTVKGRAGKSPMNKMARDLIEMGRDPQSPVTVKRGDTVCFNVLPLEWWAGHAISEADRTSPRFTKYVPMPEAAKGGV